jgi:hypothetical protein
MYCMTASLTFALKPLPASVEDREDRGRGSDSRGELLHRLMKRIRLGGDQNEIEWLMQVVGQHGRRGNGEIAVRTDDAQSIAGELLRAPACQTLWGHLPICSKLHAKPRHGHP